MVTVPQAKAFIDKVIVDELERVIKVLTIADLGLKAKQTDVHKVKALMQARIDKLK